MMEFWKECATGSQITIVICLTVIILAVIAVISLFIWRCKCNKQNVELMYGKGTTSSDAGKGGKGIPEKSEDEKKREIRQEQEDRAKALVKDMFEATREKKINAANQKEEKCDISITKELIALYEKVLKDMRTI